MARRRRKRARIPRNAVGVIKSRGGYRFVVRGKKVPRSLLKRRRMTRRRTRRRRR